MAGTSEHDLGVAILLLLAQGVGHVEVYVSGESEARMFGVVTETAAGDEIHGDGPTVTEAAENAVRQLPPI